MKQKTNAEQEQIRQSAPKPTVQDEIAKQLVNGIEQGQSIGSANGINAFGITGGPVNKKFIDKLNLTLMKYKEGKANLERRIVENERWYKLRHWECLRGEQKVQPTSGWLFNCIENKHADAMDNFPAPNILPREEGDKGEAEMLSSIIPVILDQNDFENTYANVQHRKLVAGTGIYGIFWNSDKLNGLGDIEIVSVDPLRIFYEPGITDIQKSRYLFTVDIVDNEVLIEQNPKLEGKLGRSTLNVAEYTYDDKVDTTEKSIIVDAYYKKVNRQGKKVLHYVKYVNDEILFATENDPQFAERGLYDHAEFPYEFDVLFPTEGTPMGFSYIDVGKSAQEYIDRGNAAIMQNLLANARPRFFIRSDGSVNEDEYADTNNDFIHVDGNLGTDSVMPVKPSAMSALYVNILDRKIEELKETTGNRDVSTGGTTSGVTAASGIASMIEQGSKMVRNHNKASFRVFRRLTIKVIELIRQFYDMPRCFRIMGQNGAMRFVQYSNAGILPVNQGIEFGIDMGMRVPLFDVDVTPQKKNAYSKVSQNELALQFYQAGFFNPQLADQALIALDMMDFDRKEFIMQKISQQGGMMQQMMMLAQVADEARGTNEIAPALAQQYGMQGGQGGTESDITLEGEESPITRKARERVAGLSTPT